MANRAAQFRPFAALTGYGDAINETARLTDKKIDLDADAIAILDRKLMEISTNISTQPSAKITYFVPDTKKKGGQYRTSEVNIKKIDTVEQAIVTTSGERILIKDIIEIEQL